MCEKERNRKRGRGEEQTATDEREKTKQKLKGRDGQAWIDQQGHGWSAAKLIVDGDVIIVCSLFHDSSEHMPPKTVRVGMYVCVHMCTCMCT